MQRKSSLRKHFLQIRSELSKEQVVILSRDICANLRQYLKATPDMIVAGYIPLGNEVNISPLLEELSSQCITCLPVITHEHLPLEFHKWQTGDKLITSKFNKHIKEPDTNSKPLLPDIILTPLVAYDNNNYRLGFGGGYYDRTFAELEKHKNIQKIGVAYQIQYTLSLPIEKHDYKLDVVITR
jgi:5-formyltetrahydrofolate cyclo-ligase